MQAGPYATFNAQDAFFARAFDESDAFEEFILNTFDADGRFDSSDAIDAFNTIDTLGPIDTFDAFGAFDALDAFIKYNGWAR